MLHQVLSFKIQPTEIANNFVEYNFCLITHNRSGSDSYVVLNDLPRWRTAVKIFKNGAGIFSLKKIQRCVNENKEIPQYVHFRCGSFHFDISSKNIGFSYKLKPSFLKQEMEHDETYEDT